MKVRLHRKAFKDLKGIPPKHRAQIDEHLKALKSDPHPPGTVPIQGVPNGHRLKSGNYRICFLKLADTDVFFVFAIATREGVYEKLSRVL